MTLQATAELLKGWTCFYTVSRSLHLTNRLAAGRNHDPSHTSQFRKMCSCILFCLCHMGRRMQPRASNSKQTEMQRHLLLLEKRQRVSGSCATMASSHRRVLSQSQKKSLLRNTPHHGSCEAALVALLKLCSDLPLERKLPDGYRETWLEAIGDLPAVNQPGGLRL